ncbi:Phosphoribosylamine--glycine ligase [Koleobacter methoxysyntrophicus]|uniref:Phosphoribosylamine--glycine ligase n=1 Tax=Koleobacter methoxysyntrophicus TaxID=2751313 RepID=A0A8A0RIA3_9FIRM|nr:phosphoribosylamine--glycine ligase [Koleobacter methoxysyntrophicus]QSQ08005.1 Phosphoribosylamine--glycine ligase [Koleobacter methoxysyntrophicus]
MKVMVVGGGGREHTLVWKIKQSPLVKEIYCAPGNAGIERIAVCINIPAENIEALAEFALNEKIDLTVVGPEAPLTLGIVDEFEKRGLKVFGPSKKAAEIEGSKVFAKELMERYGIPTAHYRVFNDPIEAGEYIKDKGAPVVVKADGLAAGKGVIVALTEDEALDGVKRIMRDREFGRAGDRIVVEEYLEGPEVSILAFTDGNTIIPMVSAQDHKRVYDNDRGPNTGGMGAFAPSPVYTPNIARVVEKEILKKTIDAMKRENRPYKGVLYAGLMITSKGPKVLEFNCRFGDPETQVVLPLLESDLVPVMQAVIDSRLDEAEIRWKDKKAVCVIMASGGYPRKYEKGFKISGIEEAEKIEGITVFHAGTAKEGDSIVTAGGRVLGVTALGDSLDSAARLVYKGVEKISFKGAHYRKDIGRK